MAVMATETETHNLPQAELLLANWQGEMDSADLYHFLATREVDEQRASLLRDMADAESRHARVMERGLAKQGVTAGPHRLGFKTRLLKSFARLFGRAPSTRCCTAWRPPPRATTRLKTRTLSALAGEERTHARSLGELSRRNGGVSERWHRSAGGGTLRATIFGVSDGLVSNLSLVMGFAGAQADAKFLLLAGLSGLLAGAASMAAGEYVSMKAQRELLERQIALEAAELAVTPEEEVAELALIYRAKGLPLTDAERLAAPADRRPQGRAGRAGARGAGPRSRASSGSPIGAAVSSFLAFAIGALIPVVPFFFGDSLALVATSLVLSGVALFGVGAVLSLFTGKGAMFSGGRQLVIGAVAATITFAVGKAIGVSTGV